jgi:tetratricopeptide (TPR) repeat protein
VCPSVESTQISDFALTRESGIGFDLVTTTKKITMSSESNSQESFRTGDDEHSEEALDSLPFQGAGLRCGAVYAIGIETAAARMPLLSASLQAALRADRPCVLITRLSPEEEPLAAVLAHTRQMVGANRGDDTNRLQVFSAVGDYTVNLFLYGVDRYLQELDQFEVAPGSLLLIDEADDLYTPHDHGALIQQARAYQAWCKRNQHTMLQLHLRTSAQHPMMEGNQAAAQYLSGIARAISHPEGLRIAIDFWESTACLRTGTMIPLDPLKPLFNRVRTMNGAAAAHSAGTASDLVAAATTRPSLWSVSATGADLGDWSDQFQVRTASSLTEVIEWYQQGGGDDLSIVVTLGTADEFTGFIAKLPELRATAGNRARIVVRESCYRLREHTQKRLLLRAGVDWVLSPSQSMKELTPLLLQLRLAPVVNEVHDEKNAPDPWAVEAQGDEAGGQGRLAFVDECEQRMRHNTFWQVPCTLVEVDFEDPLASDTLGAMTGTLPAGRKGDLSIVTSGVQFFFLQGCCGRDVLNVVTRCTDDAVARWTQRIHLYTGESAIVARLLQLRQDAVTEALLATASHERTANNVMTLPASGRQSRGNGSMAVLAALSAALALGWPSADACAQDNPGTSTSSSPDDVATSAQHYEQGHYAEAARQGLIELHRDPDDHELRYRVANSLAWTGQHRPAIEQYGLLIDTPRAASARIGMANVHLWSSRPHLADPLFRQALEIEPSNADAEQGLASAARQLRPRTTLRGERIDDSTRAERATVMLTHRWRDAGLAQIFEISGERIDERRSTEEGPALQPRKVSFAYQNLALPLEPKAQLSSGSEVGSSVFGNLALHLADGTVSAVVGRVNWGEIAFDPRARREGLTAWRVGVNGSVGSDIGSFSGSATHFAVSDANRVAEINAQFTPAWQFFPAASGMRGFVGVYGRKAERQDPRYWSPSGYYTGQVGLSLNQSAADWDLNAEIRRSERIGGEGAGGWTVGLSGSRWLSRDWAARIESFHIETRRDDAAYRSTSIALSIDHLW